MEAIAHKLILLRVQIIQHVKRLVYVNNGNVLREVVEFYHAHHQQTVITRELVLTNAKIQAVVLTVLGQTVHNAQCIPNVKLVLIARSIIVPQMDVKSLLVLHLQTVKTKIYALSQ